MSYKSLFSACLAGFFFFSLLHTLTPSRETTDDCSAGGGSLVLSDLRAPHISTGGPCGRGANPVFPHQEVCLVNFSPLLHEKNFYKASTTPFNEASQAVRRLPPPSVSDMLMTC